MGKETTQLILLRHGESQWNLENRFTGWYDVSLTEKGDRRSKNAGQMLLSAGLLPDVVHIPTNKSNSHS